MIDEKNKTRNENEVGYVVLHVKDATGVSPGSDVDPSKAVIMLLIMNSIYNRINGGRHLKYPQRMTFNFTLSIIECRAHTPFLEPEIFGEQFNQNYK